MKDCKVALLSNFLKNNSAEVLYLVGDIIDGWKIQKNQLHWRQEHTNIVRKILGFSKHKGHVIYITGNHDEFLRSLITYGIGLGNIEIVNEFIHRGVDGKKYLVIHGDLFDGITKLHKWLCFLGDTGYDIVLNINNKYNYIRHKLGFGYWSLSRYIKYKVKQAVAFMYEFESSLVEHCKRKGYDGVICGHIHNAEIKEIAGIVYMNDGDWIESCTALVEHLDGRWEIVTWDRIK